MNKFKKILLGTLSVLTLGLFVGTKVSAATLNDVRTISSDGTTSSWDFASTSVKALSSNYTIPAKTIDYIDGFTNDAKDSGKINKDGYLEIPANKHCFLSVPSGASGNFKFTCKDNITSETEVSKQRTVTIGETTLYTNSTEQTIAFTSDAIETITGLDGSWLQIACNSAKPARISSASIELTTGNYKSIWTVNFYENTADTDTYYTENVVDGNTISNWPTDPSKDGYDFVGWATSGNVTYTSSSSITSNLNLYAQWDQQGVQKVDVIFNSNGGSSVDTQHVAIGSNAIEPTEPTRDGYTFIGWFDSSLTNEYDFSTSVTETLTLYAKWQKALNTNVVTTSMNYSSFSGDGITNTVLGDFELLVSNTKYNDKYNAQFTFSDNYFKSNGASSFENKTRLIKFTAYSAGKVKINAQTGKTGEARTINLLDSTGKTCGSVSVNTKGDYEINVNETGIYYVSFAANITVYTLAFEFTTAVPTVELYKDLNSQDNNEFRIVAKIDNLSINGTNLDYIKSVVISINDTTFTRTVSKVYKAVDSTNSGRYQLEDNVCYAVMSFTGYEKATNAFTIKVTVNYNGGSVVEEIEIPSYANRNN